MASLGCWVDVPRQQFIDAIDRMVADSLEHRGQIIVRVDAIEFGRAKYRVQHGGSLASGDRASKQIIFPAQGDGS